MAAALLGWPLVIGWQIQGLETEAVGRLYLVHTALASMAALVLLGYRAWQGGAYGPGWWLLVGGQGAYVLTQGLRLAGGPSGVLLMLELTGGLAQFSALIVWPWSKTRREERSLWGLGALLFPAVCSCSFGFWEAGKPA